MKGDIYTGIRFLKELSCCPDSYKKKIDEIEVFYQNNELSEKNLSGIAEFFRQENWKYIQGNEKNSDRANLVASLMMFTVALGFASE